MKNLALSIFIVASACFTSCSPPISEENKIWISKIDSTLIELNKSKNLLNQMDSAKLEKMAVRYNNLSQEAFSYYTAGDTRSIWKNELADVQFCAKSVPRFISERPSIYKGLNESNNQLTALKHDLENNLVAKDKVTSYVNIELQAAQLIAGKAGKRGGRAKNCYDNYDYIVFKTDSLIQILKQ